MSYSAPETPSNEFQLPQDEWGLATKLAIASISSQVNIQNTSVKRRMFKNTLKLLVFERGHIVKHAFCLFRAQWEACFWVDFS